MIFNAAVFYLMVKTENNQQNTNEYLQNLKQRTASRPQHSGKTTFLNFSI